MDAETFKMVDGILTWSKVGDGRINAESLLEIGVQLSSAERGVRTQVTLQGSLQEYAQVIANQYSLRQEVVLEWYAETLTRRIQNATTISEKLSRILKDYDQ